MRKCVSLAACMGLLVAIGCSQETPKATAPQAALAVDGSKYLLSSEPEGATGVTQVREEAKDKDDVVIVGRIGGSEESSTSRVEESVSRCSSSVRSLWERWVA